MKTKTTLSLLFPFRGVFCDLGTGHPQVGIFRYCNSGCCIRRMIINLGYSLAITCLRPFTNYFEHRANLLKDKTKTHTHKCPKVVSKFNIIRVLVYALQDVNLLIAV